MYAKGLIPNRQHSPHGTTKGIKTAPQLYLTPPSGQEVDSGT